MTRERTWEIPPSVPSGWEARWSEAQGSFYFRHERTDRWFWGIDVPVLQELGLLPVCRFILADAKRCFRLAAVRLHPDKRGDVAAFYSAAVIATESTGSATASEAAVALAARTAAICWRRR